MKRKQKKRLRKILANVMLFIIFDVMWTSMFLYGFMTATTLN